MGELGPEAWLHCSGLNSCYHCWGDGLRLRIGWWCFPPKILQGPRQGRKGLNRAMEAIPPARGSPASRSWLPAAPLPADERSLSQWPSRGAGAQPAPPAPGQREREAQGDSWSPAWAQLFAFKKKKFLLLCLAVQGFQLLTLIYSFHPFNIR